jgi:hypothetical protein
MSIRLNADVHFCDFSDFFAKRYIPKVRIGSTASPTFSPDGNLLVSAPIQKIDDRRVRKWGRSVADACGLMEPYRKLRDGILGQKRWDGPIGPTLAAWLTFKCES